MLKRDLLKVIGLGTVSGLVGGTLLKPERGSQNSAPALDRILQTGQIKLGYTPYSVGFQIDPNTGRHQGIYVDIVSEMCGRLSLKANWVAETGWGTQIQGLQTGLFDMIGSPVSLTSARARAADFSLPLYYSPVHAWSHNKDFATTELNNPSVTIATLDGEQTDAFADTYFPRARKLSLPQSTSFAELLGTVATRKADITFAEPLPVTEYNAHNTKPLYNISSERPLLLVPNILLLPQDQPGFKAMIDNALTDLHLSGFIASTLDKWETIPGSYVRATGLR